MIEKIKDRKILALLNDNEMTNKDRIAALMKLRDDARAEQRMASESPADSNDGLQDQLRELELALDRLGETPAEQEGLGPASL